jgi:hypothetical protein
MEKIKNKLYYSNLLPNIIFQTLVYNGMLSYYKFNPKMTDSTIIPNKNTKYKEWETHILSNIDISTYAKSFHAFSNTILGLHSQVESSVCSLRSFVGSILIAITVHYKTTIH